MSAESPRHARAGGPLTVPSQPPSDRTIIDAVSGFINDVTLSSAAVDPKDVIQWARFETADINEPTPEGDSDDISPLLLILGYGSGVQVWLIPPTGEAQEVLSWRQGTVRVLRILPTPQHGDCFTAKRPLIALCDSASPGPSFCSLSFISIRGGEQVKSIKFKNPILDVLANKRSVVVSFSERFAVFDAGTLEDRMAITTCYPCPCPLGGSAPINPLTLGDRWLAYADKKLNQSKRSSGGCEGEGVTSYTATVLHAAKSLSKGLRGLGESVAHSLAGGRSTSQSPSPPNADIQQPGVVTVLDIENNEEEDGQENDESYDPIVAHFIAHSEAIIALKFDASGALLVTADRRGHDFHVFRVNPHPCGSSLASVHHLYVLHRGDTTAKVQDIAISPDSRWTAISTLRGTTHIFAISPYGGACGVRTHTSPRVVNRLSRFHRSAGLPIHAHTHTHVSGSPVSDGLAQGAWFPNPRLPPYPQPTTVAPLAQLRPTANLPTHTITRNSAGRQRLSSLSEECNTAPLLARARFGLAISGAGAKCPPGPAAALYLVAASGCLSHLALHVRPARCVPKEKICDESPIEVEVEGIAQWPLQRPSAATDLLAPLPPSNPLLQPMSCRRCADMCMSEEERWLSQVEIVTHAGPHRRLWMGPQFVFKTYNCTGSNSSLSEAETVEVEACAARSVARSNPVNMPGARPLVPLLIDSGSASSLEHSPSDNFRRKSLLAETGRAASACDVQLKEDLAEAMKEDQGWRGESRSASPRAARAGAGVERVVDPLGTVVAPRRAPRAPPLDDSDSYTSSNADEATFRPVVRAPANIPLHPDMVVRPLPRNTTIPVQTITPVGSLSPEDEPIPLNTDVVIPAALTNVREWLSDQETEASITSKVVVEATDEAVKVEVSEETAVVVEKIAERKDTAVKIEKTETQKDAEPKKEKTAKSRQIDYEESVSEGIRPIIEEEKSLKVEKHVEYDKVASEIEKPVRDTPKVEKPSRRKDSPPKHAKSTVQKETDKIVEHKVSLFKTDKPDEKNTATWLDKSFAQKDITAKLDISTKQKENKTEKPIGRKDDADKYAKPAKQAVDERKTTQPDSVDRVNVDVKRNDVNKDLKRQDDVRKGDSARERSSAECAERESDDSKSLPKSNRQPDDIQPTARIRVKKSPTPKSVSDTDSEVSLKDKSKKIDDVKELKETKETIEIKETKEIKKQKEIREHKYIKDTKAVKSRDSVDKTVVPIIKDEEPSVEVSFKLPTKKEFPESKIKKRVEPEIKTEEQAWDMLLNEPEKPLVLSYGQQTTVNDKTDDKPKTKKNRKLKKSQEDMQEKADEDSFVEIHAIEEKQQPCSGELVSISTPFEDVDHMSYLSKAKKPRSPKSFTPEKRDEFEKKSIDFLSHEAFEIASKLKPGKYETYDISDIEVFSDASYSQREVKDTFNTTPKANKYAEVSSSETSFVVKESKPSKSKSLSPYPEWRKVDKPIDVAEKDVYVINTTEDDFPEIQITRGTKPRKRSPQPAERKSLEKEPVIDKPIKSWSSIAASKNDKMDVERKIETVEKIFDKKKDELKDESDTDENKMSSTISLQEKLFELCKRTDIMVAECDTPSELNFVEEHHSVLHDLPPLEPLDFGLDDFNLEVMRDSLLEVNDAKITSPICKINIDDILSSIKETTAKVIESSTFNLIDLEKVPAKKEKGFSVIESHKITSQEVKIDDDKPETEVMEKSSDEDITSPVVTTDSDKDDKKIAGASNSILPSSKQSAKSKKSRRKKK